MNGWNLILGLVLMFQVSLDALGQNPIITHMYTADPSARVFNDTLYLYPSHDRDSALWWDMTDWHVFSTTNLKDYTDHGVALDIKDVNWASKYAWAPDCNFKNGKYYFYFPTDQDYIGVAESDKPTGPFVDVLGKPLITRQTPGVRATQDLIDPCIFIDDDGTPYLFFGQNDVNMVQLNEDMMSFEGSVKIIEGADHFFEGVWVHKKDDYYYLSYSGNGKILYGMSKNVQGPYEFKGEVLGKVNSGTNHHSIVEYKGHWILFYHTADLSLKNIPESDPHRYYVTWRRSVAAEPLFHNEDGTIQKVEQTSDGLKNIQVE